MRIECPTCHAVYEVPPERLAPGRMVRCARCAARWSPEPAAPTQPAPARAPATAAPLPEHAPATAAPLPEHAPATAAPLPEHAPAPPEPPPRPTPEAAGQAREPVFASAARAAGPDLVDPEPPARPPARPALVVAWLLTMFVLAGAVWGVLSFRAEIVRAWPPAARFYGLIEARH